MRFRVTDTAQTIPVTYTGMLPDLFKEGKGVVAQGTLGPDGVFHASEVLAKHDENYMPPEAADAVKKAHDGMTMKTSGDDERRINDSRARPFRTDPRAAASPSRRARCRSSGAALASRG